MKRIIVLFVVILIGLIFAILYTRSSKPKYVRLNNNPKIRYYTERTESDEKIRIDRSNPDFVLVS
jgi:hypothetical protein